MGSSESSLRDELEVGGDQLGRLLCGTPWGWYLSWQYPIRVVWMRKRKGSKTIPRFCVDIGVLVGLLRKIGNTEAREDFSFHFDRFI